MYSGYTRNAFRIYSEHITNAFPGGVPGESQLGTPPGTLPHPGGNVVFQSVPSRAERAENFMPMHVGSPPRVPWGVVRGSALHPSQGWFLSVRTTGKIVSFVLKRHDFRRATTK